MEVEDWRTVARYRASCTERDIRRAELEVEDWRTVARDRASCTERDIRRTELEVEDWRTVARDRASPRGTSGGRSWRSRTGGRWPGIEPRVGRWMRVVIRAHLCSNLYH